MKRIMKILQGVIEVRFTTGKFAPCLIILTPETGEMQFVALPPEISEDPDKLARELNIWRNSKFINGYTALHEDNLYIALWNRGKYLVTSTLVSGVDILTWAWTDGPSTIGATLMDYDPQAMLRRGKAYAYEQIGELPGRADLDKLKPAVLVGLKSNPRLMPQSFEASIIALQALRKTDIPHVFVGIGFKRDMLGEEPDSGHTIVVNAWDSATQREIGIIKEVNGKPEIVEWVDGHDSISPLFGDT